MTAYDSLPGGVTEIFGAEATAEQAYGLLTVDVPAGSWIPALEIARDKLGCTYFDWLSAVDEPGTGFQVCAHVVALEGHRVRRLLLRTTVPHAAPVLPSAVDIYAGAAWHERETHEMFGVDFTDHPHLVPLLLPEGFEGHPLRKDFVLAARVAKAWPGAKEPGESEHGGPKRRQMLPPGVPDPNEWGPLKGQLPPAPARPARTPRAAGAGAGAAERPARAAGDRPVRRARTASEGSASQAETPAAPDSREATAAPEAPAVRPRRTRTASDGSASQAAATPESAGPPEATGAPEAAVRPRRTSSASEGSVSQQADAAQGQPAEPAAPPRTHSSDAPWHNPKPAFAEGEPEPAASREPAPASEAAAASEPAPASEAAPASEPAPASEAASAPESASPPEPVAAPEPASTPEAAPASEPAAAPGAEAPEAPDAAEPNETAGGDPRE
ncbi:NADH-quinone oxidoreductase subunit C [Streptomyces sp. NPDC050485]|uniref:NADH-quinone oxidoreductase subunit C n=1 Tax=Streptomyces sp. NPDC050485 TaxID=3365617 RepID=UPI0037B231FE